MEDCSTDERLQQETLCCRQWTEEYVEHPENCITHASQLPFVELENVDGHGRAVVAAGWSEAGTSLATMTTS